MKTYKLDPEKLPKQLRSVILLYGATFLVMLVVLYLINRNNPNSNQMIWMIPLLAVLYGFMGWRAYKTRAELWNGYELQISEQGIIQNQPKYPELRIARHDLTAVDEKPNGLILSTVQAQRVLGVPREFLTSADYDSIRSTLNAWVAENEEKKAAEPDAEEEHDTADAKAEDIAEAADQADAGMDEQVVAAADEAEELGKALEDTADAVEEKDEDTKTDTEDA